ncbi:MAG: hypothetical protein ABGX22_19810 [Pirellulaceae bacterium]
MHGRIRDWEVATEWRANEHGNGPVGAVVGVSPGSAKRGDITDSAANAASV